MEGRVRACAPAGDIESVDGSMRGYSLRWLDGVTLEPSPGCWPADAKWRIVMWRIERK